MTSKEMNAPELLSCPFERGQVWENPDNEIMMVISVRRDRDAYKVNYLSEEGEFGSFWNTKTEIIKNISLVKPTDLSPQTVPAGWKLVPIEPTEEILKAAWLTRPFAKYELTQTDRLIDPKAMSDLYKAMLAAAPELPAEKLPHIEGLSEAIDHCEAIEKELREGNQYPKSFVMQIPARPYADSDFMFYRLFKAAREYLKRMEGE